MVRLPRKLTPPIQAEIIRMYHDQKLTQLEISKEVKVAEATICGFLKKSDLSRSNGEARKLAISRGHIIPYNSKADLANQMVTLYLQGLSCTEVAESLGISKQTARKYIKQQGPLRNKHDQMVVALARHPGCNTKNHPKGAEHWNWKGGKVKTSQGYYKVLMPQHPRATKSGYVLEHILVWEQVHNRPLPKGWEVHHLNGIHNDNRPENLKGLPNKKHQLVIPAMQKRIRELEAKGKLLERALDQNQMIFGIGEN